MAYEKQEWIDHITDEDGNVVQQGTAMDAEHFNHMEEGIYNANINQAFLYIDDSGYLCVITADDENLLNIGDSSELELAIDSANTAAATALAAAETAQTIADTAVESATEAAVAAVTEAMAIEDTDSDEDYSYKLSIEDEHVRIDLTKIESDGSTDSDDETDE